MRVIVGFPEGVIEEIDNIIKTKKKWITRNDFVIEACKEKIERELKKEI